MAKARNRRRQKGRRSPFRNRKPIILVVTEGEATEPQYLRGLQQACRNPRVTIKVAPEHGKDPKALVGQAKQRKDDARERARQEDDDNLAYNWVWCVFDIDENHKDYRIVDDAVQMAQRNGICVAISNPCFELWLLLHFRENPGQQNRRQMKTLLRKHVSGYDKHVDYATYSAGYDDAVRRAERMAHDADDAGESFRRNPTTGFYKLTELIRG